MRINGSSIARLASLRSCSTAEIDVPFAYRCHVDRIIGFGAARRPSLRVATPVSTSYLGFRRGAKTKSTVKLKDLPQGALKAEPLADWVDDAPRYPTVLQGHKNNMQKFKNCVILTRVGGFYELYFEQAEELAPLLNLKLAWKKTSVGSVPMAGFPFFQLDRFLKALVQDLNKYVAISEEFAAGTDDRKGSTGLLFDRRVARIITPGTLIDEKFMDPSQNNFLLAIYIDIPALQAQVEHQNDGSSTYQHVLSSTSQHVGLSWLDLSTGDFFTQLTTAQMLPSAIARIGAREILVDQGLQDFIGQELQSLMGHDERLMTFIKFRDEVVPMSQWNSMLEAPIDEKTIDSFTREEVAAGSSLLDYIRVQLQGLDLKLQPPRRRHLNESMNIDRNSLRGLEILESARDGFGKGSLLHAVRRTSTKSGARLLRDRLTSPSTSLQVINDRLDLVSLFLSGNELRDSAIQLLKRSYDSQRLAQKFTLGRGDPDDLVCLSRAIEASKEIRRVMSAFIHENHSSPLVSSLLSMINRLYLDGPSALAGRILAAIDEEGLQQKQRIENDTAAEAATLAQEVTLSEGAPSDLEALPKKVRSKGNIDRTNTTDEFSDEDTWIMRRDASPALRKLHQSLAELHEERIKLTQTLRDEVGSSALSLKWTPGLGHICHVKGARISQQVLEELGVTRSVSSTKTTRSFHLPAWTQLGGRIDQIKLQIRQEEQAIFESLRREVILNLVKIRRNAAVMDELDVACSFATLAEEQQLVRPILTQGTGHNIVGGRHPTVKLGLEEQGRRFVSNDCFLGSSERIWLITGPNMAGKSTFLRQNALITILAQVGSFVPADYAEIGIVDQIFSRIGAADDLFRDQSTFMVEMLETATILKQATSRSFVIMDEVGRGTTPEDGTAVSFACLHHLHYRNQCRTLFATHFHSLADMTQDFEALGRYCTDIKETASGSFSFVHRLRQGVNRESHALKVAQLAGLPSETIDMARAVRRNVRKDS